MRLDDLTLWYLGAPAIPRYVGALRLVSAGKGVSLHYGREWLTSGFALSEDLPLIDNEFLPPGRLAVDAQRAVGAVDDARPDRWGEKVIRFVEKPKRLSLMEYLYFAGDDRFGALGVSTSSSSYIPRPGSPLPRLGDAQQLSEVAAKIEAADAAAGDLIKKANLPAGLSMNEEGVLLNNRPFSQAGTAEKILASAEVRMALAPHLRVMLIDEGSELDSHMLKLLSDLAAKKDYQIWLAKVDEGGAPGFVIEDGRVAAHRGEAAE
jgi:hypothetical protein